MPCSPIPELPNRVAWQSTPQARLVGKQLGDQIPKERYPQLAIQHGWQGKVHICIRLSQDGRIEQTAILHSSGNTFLDTEALRVVQLVKRFTLDPPLEQPWIIAEVPFNYQLPIPPLERQVGDSVWAQLTKTARHLEYAGISDLKGAVIWRVRLDTDGRIRSMELEQSSGFDRLDESAKNIIAGSEPFPLHSVDPKSPSILIVPIGFNLHIW